MEREWDWIGWDVGGPGALTFRLGIGWNPGRVFVVLVVQGSISLARRGLKEWLAIESEVHCSLHVEQETDIPNLKDPQTKLRLFVSAFMCCRNPVNSVAARSDDLQSHGKYLAPCCSSKSVKRRSSTESSYR